RGRLSLTMFTTLGLAFSTMSAMEGVWASGPNDEAAIGAARIDSARAAKTPYRDMATRLSDGQADPVHPIQREAAARGTRRVRRFGNRAEELEDVAIIIDDENIRHCAPPWNRDAGRPVVRDGGRPASDPLVKLSARSRPNAMLGIRSCAELSHWSFEGARNLG